MAAGVAPHPDRVDAAEAALQGLRRALLAAARSGRTLTAGEASAAAYGAWVPSGLSRALHELGLRCASAAEPDLTCLVEHRPPPGARPPLRPLPRTARPDDDDAGLAPDHSLDVVALERQHCWRHWGGERARSARAVLAPPSRTARAVWEGPPALRHPASGAFAEPGVVCGTCLAVVRTSGACRCP